MLRWFRDLPIKHKLLFIFSIQILLPLVLMGLMYYLKISSSMEGYSDTSSRDTLIQVEMRILDFRQNVKRVSTEFIYNKELYSIFGKSKNSMIYQTQIMRLRDLVSNRIQTFDEIQAIAIMDNSKIKPVLSENRGDMDVNIADVLPRTILKTKLNQNDEAVWYLKEMDEKQFLFFSCMINDLDTYHPLGFLVILVDLDTLKDSYKELFSGLLQNVYILTPHGNIFFGANDPSREILETVQRAIKGINEGIISQRVKGMRLVYRKIPESEWGIISVINEQELIRDFLSLRTWLIFIFIPVVALLALLSILTSLDIVDPIERLAIKMKDFNPGQKFTSLELRRRDELGSLAVNFNQMAAKIIDLMKKIVEERTTREKAQLKALHAQINPHFLFNTLQAISGEAQLKNNLELSKMIMALSSLMEVAIARDTKMISLKDELRYIENYIYIMKIRYRDKFEIRWDLDHSLLNIQVPSLILQPIIENAFTHGILKNRHKGLLTITIRKDRKLIIIEIFDNGPGLSKEQAESLNDCIHKEVPEESDCQRQRVGLRNVHQRLKFSFGPEYGLKFVVTGNKEVRVVITIPDQRRLIS